MDNHSTMDDTPLVSCLMVTADRPRFCRRAVRCYQNQTYENRELVVVDDGEADLSDVLAEVPAAELRYVRIPKQPGNVLGRLRNLALEQASGSLLAQWDDDDWYHPDRLARQVEVISRGLDACVLSGTLMHLDTDAYFHHPYIGFLPDGVPGSIMHVRDDAIRYPEIRRGEDTTYLKAWMERPHAVLPSDQVHLFIRCFHGENTWEIDHFLRRIRNTLPDLLAYGWHAFVRRDLFGHPRFRLDEVAREAFAMYLEDSRALGIFPKA